MTEEIQIVEAGIEVFEAQERASIDIQVATAKKYPRDLRKVMENSIFIATLDKDTASKCRYAKPVGGKSITGPYRDWETDRKSTRLNSSHLKLSRMPSSA